MSSSAPADNPHAVALLGALLVAGVGAGAEIGRAADDLRAAKAEAVRLASGAGAGVRVIGAGGVNRFGISTGEAYTAHPDPAQVGRPPVKQDRDLAARVRSEGAPRAVEAGGTLVAAAPTDAGTVTLATLPAPDGRLRFGWGLSILLWLTCVGVSMSLSAWPWIGLTLLASAMAFVASPAPALAGGVACLLLQSSTRSVIGHMRHSPAPYLYALPAMVALGLLIMVPFAVGVGMSAFRHLDGVWSFVGLRHFVEILSPEAAGDTHFYRTLGVTVLWTASNVFLHLFIGLGLALLLREGQGPMTAVYRVLLVLPWAVPNYITALTWKGMFNQEFGAVNAALSLVGVAPVDWLGSTFLPAFTANLVTNTWLGFPFMMVVSLGALQSIPAELYEAARVDGAGRWAQLRHVTLPLLKPALFPAVILGSIWTFNMFNVIYLVSGGAPAGQTDILITEAYRAFRVLGRYGYAAAYSTVIFGILLAYTLITNRVTRATEGVS